MSILVPDLIFLPMIAMCIIAVLLFFTLMGIRGQAPEAFMLMKARKKKQALCMVHYPEGTCRLKEPKHVKPPNPDSGVPYFKLDPEGIKFKNPDGSKFERFGGDVPIINYFSNIPESVKMREAVAYSQLKDYLKKNDVDIDGIEDITMYVFSEYEKTGDMKKAIKNSKINNEDVVRRIVKYLEFIDNNRQEIEDMKLQSGTFTWQTAMMALDSTIAYTSANVAHLKSVIEAQIRRQLGDEKKDLITKGIFIFLACLGAFVLLQAL